MKLSEENIGVNFCDLGLGNGFFDMTSKAQAMKENTESLNIFKIKNFVYQGASLYLEGMLPKS